MIRWFVRGEGNYEVPVWPGRIAYDTISPSGYIYYMSWPADRDSGIRREFTGLNNVGHMLSIGWWREINPEEDEDWLDEGI